MKMLNDCELEALSGGSKVCDFIGGASIGLGVAKLLAYSVSPWLAGITLVGAVGCGMGWW